jgi:hypothetical protein
LSNFLIKVAAAEEEKEAKKREFNTWEEKR